MDKRHPLQKLVHEIMQEHGVKFHLDKPLHEYLPGERPEREGAEVGSVYVLSKEDIEGHRIGNCWMAERLKVGDVCMCIKHAGDCFNDYILLDVLENAVRGIPESKFGAYVLNTNPLAWRPTTDEFIRLCHGKHVQTVIPQCLMIERGNRL